MSWFKINMKRIPTCMFCRKKAKISLDSNFPICENHLKILKEMARKEYKILFTDHWEKPK